MKPIAFLLIAFVGIGMVSRTFNGKTRLLLLFIIACVVGYVTLHLG